VGLLERKKRNMDADVRKAVLWLETEHNAGRLDDELFEFFMKSAVTLTIERKLSPRLKQFEDRVDARLSRLGVIDS
jgi:hypothetical protein